MHPRETKKNGFGAPRDGVPHRNRGLRVNSISEKDTSYVRLSKCGGKFHRNSVYEPPNRMERQATPSALVRNKIAMRVSVGFAASFRESRGCIF